MGPDKVLPFQDSNPRYPRGPNPTPFLIRAWHVVAPKKYDFELEFLSYSQGWSEKKIVIITRNLYSSVLPVECLVSLKLTLIQINVI